MAAYSLLPRLGEARRTTNIPRKVTLVESNGASGVSSHRKGKYRTGSETERGIRHYVHTQTECGT